MSKWKEVKLGHLGVAYSGLSGKTGEDFGAGKRFITYMNVLSNNKVSPSQMGLVNIRDGEMQNEVKVGDLLFTGSSETVEDVGMTSVLLDEIGQVYLNSFCFGFRLHNFDDLLPEFARFLFRGDCVRRQIANLGQGFTRYNLSKIQLLNRLSLILPPLPEQRKIAEILDSVDENIEKTQAMIAKLQDLKKATMKELLTNGIGHTEFKDSPVGRIPEEWEVRSLDNICTQITDGDHITPERASCGVYLLSARNVLNGEITVDDVDYVPESEYDRMIKRCFPQHGDILISCSGTIGRVCEVPHGFRCALVRSVALIKPERSLYNSRFMQWVLQSDNLQQQIMTGQFALAQANLFQGAIKQLVVPMPTFSEQEQIATAVDAIDNNIKGRNRYLSSLQDIKKALMQDLLTGKVRVKV